MRFTFVADDRRVLVDGDPRKIKDDVPLPEGIRAVQWYDTWGEIEFNDPVELGGAKKNNEKFFDMSQFNYLVDAYNEAVKRDNEDIAKMRASLGVE